MDTNVHSISVKSAIENKLNTTWLKDQFEGSMMQIEKNVNEGVKNSESNAVVTTTFLFFFFCFPSLYHCPFYTSQWSVRSIMQIKDMRSTI